MNLWIEILAMIGRLFMQPVLYITVLATLLVGYRRVRQERRYFHVGIAPAGQELKRLFGYGLLVGLVISIISIVVGGTVTYEWLVLFNCVSVISLLIFAFRLHSVAILLGVTNLLFYILLFNKWEIPALIGFPSKKGAVLEDPLMLSLTVLLSVFLFAEALLIFVTKRKGNMPTLRKSRRGKLIGAFQLKKLWFIPVVLFIPGSVIVGLFDWWPVLSIGSHTFALVIVPFAFGYQMEVQGEEPVQAVRRLAKHVLLLAIVVAILAGLSFVWPILTLAAALVAIIGRIVISIMQTRRDRHLPKRYAPQADGLMLLGAKAGSPAERMNLIAGDKIVEVNGKKVANREQFYAALNLNRAFCKLKVLDTKQEPRIEQTALYENESYELGVLLVEPK